LFDIRYRYKDVFIDKEFAICHESETSSNEHMKIYKIAYEINLLPLLGMYIKQVEGDKPWEIKLEIVNRDVQLMDMMTNSYDIGIFKAEKVREVIDFLHLPVYPACLHLRKREASQHVRVACLCHPLPYLVRVETVHGRGVDILFHWVPKLHGCPFPHHVLCEYWLLGPTWSIPYWQQDIYDSTYHFAYYKVFLLLENVPHYDLNRGDGLARNHGPKILLVPIWPLHFYHLPGVRCSWPWKRI
jgi:hypothetical protein